MMILSFAKLSRRLLRHRTFDHRIKLRSDEEGKSSDIEPREQDHDGADGAISHGVRVKKLKVDAESQNGKLPTI